MMRSSPVQEVGDVPLPRTNAATRQPGGSMTPMGVAMPLKACTWGSRLVNQVSGMIVSLSGVDADDLAEVGAPARPARLDVVEHHARHVLDLGPAPGALAPLPLQ